MELLNNNAIAPSESCLSYDTEVFTMRGAMPIGKIVENQMSCHIYTIDESGVAYFQRIEQWHDRGTQEVFEYTLENGATVKATKDHKFMTSDGQMLPIDEIFERGLDLFEGKSYIVDGYNFKNITPDRYTCPWHHGNHCCINILKFDSGYIIQNDGCTEAFRPDFPEPKLGYEAHFNNWMLSSDLYFFYDENNFSNDPDYWNFSYFINNCINGYRNITYVKQQKKLDNSFNWEKSATPEHTYIALNNAVEPSIKLYKILQNLGRFDVNQLYNFSSYMERFCFNKKSEDREIDEIKEIFDYITSRLNNIDNILTNEVVEEFQQNYKIYKKLV